MKTTVIKTDCVVTTNSILNGFAMINDTGKGYEDATGLLNALRFGSPDKVTYRVYNGTLAKLTAADTWETVTPTRTITVGEDTINEYIDISFGSRGFLYSRSTTRIEFVSSGDSLVPVFNMTSNAVIVGNRVTFGNYLCTRSGYFLVGRNYFYEPVSTKEWSDMVNVTTPSYADTGIEYQVRLPGNMYGDIKGFNIGIEKILNENPVVYLMVYEKNNITGKIKDVLDYLAPRMPIGKKVRISITGFSDDPYNDVLVTFDGQGGYSS